MQERDRLYVRHMVDACEKIGAYTHGLNRFEFLGRSMVQDAVIRQLEIMEQRTSKTRWAQMGETLS